MLVVGTAQDGGIPHAACDGPYCRAARQSAERRRLIASLAIVLPGTGEVHMIDLTPDVRQQLDRLRPVRRPPLDGVDRSPLDGVFLTHAHIGHYLGLAFLGYEAIHTRRLPVRASERMASYLRHNGPWSQLVELGNIELDVVQPGRSVELAEGVRVVPVSVPHRDELSDTLGFRIERGARSILYIPDCDPWRRWATPPDDLVASVDVALLDGAFYSPDELPGRDLEAIGHPMITDSMDRFQRLVDAGRVEIYFTHLNHSNPVLDPDGAERREVERRGFHVLPELARFPL